MTAANPTSFRLDAVSALVPGIALPLALATTAFAFQRMTGLVAASPAVVAALLGMILGPFMCLPASFDSGLTFSSRTLLRLAVALLGLQITFGQIVAFGAGGFAVAALSLIASFVAIRAMGRVLGVDPRLSELIAAGTSICGASAIAAANTVTGGREDQVAYAIAMVTIFGSLAMLADPLIGAGLHLAPSLYGRWVGSSVHEVAQAVGAAIPMGPEALDAATLAKLSRVALLVPLIAVLRLGRSTKEEGPTLPLFLFGFLACVLLSSLFPLPHEIKMLAGQASAFLLAMALGAMGLRTHFADIRRAGLPPFVLGAFGTLFISLVALALATLMPGTL